jgi:hypothetical protein
METSWISPWNGLELTAEQLLREVELDAVSQLYVVRTLGFPEPEVTITDESIIVRAPSIPYDHEIFFPKILHELVERTFLEQLASAKAEFGIFAERSPSAAPCGAMTGEMLAYFHALDRLIRMVSANHCWSQQSILAMHGLPPDSTTASLRTDLEKAGIHYLLIYPKAQESGSGLFTAIPVMTAIQTINNLWSRRQDMVRECFDLDRDYGQYAWIADDNNWVAD